MHFATGAQLSVCSGRRRKCFESGCHVIGISGMRFIVSRTSVIVLAGFNGRNVRIPIIVHQ